MSTKDPEGFLDYFEDLEDPRIDRKKMYPMDEILLLTLTAVICGSEGWLDIEAFGREKIDYLQQFLPYTNGTPSDDTLRRFFRRIDPKGFQERFAKWMKSLSTLNKKLISIDGKVSRHTFDGDQNPLHMVSAFASESRLVLAQAKVSDKSNEITAIPELLALLDLSGSIVTIDAMGCQRAIAEQIQEAKADYVLSLKGNQGILHDDIKLLFQDGHILESLDKENICVDVDSGHGRIETRQCKVLKMPPELSKIHNWSGLKTVVEIESTREFKDKVESEKRYYISSLEMGAKGMLHAIRSHRAIENSLHYVLDIAFRDDESRIRKGNAPMNIGIIKQAALNLLRKNQRKRESIKGLRKVAGWNNERLSQIIF
ncbi:MAG: ISAs1 family transposase [Pseudobdellovibrionaceae bacterium]